MPELDSTYMALRAWCAQRSLLGKPLSLGLDLDALSLSLTFSALQRKLEEASRLASIQSLATEPRPADAPAPSPQTADESGVDPSLLAASAQGPALTEAPEPAIDLPERHDERFEVVGALSGGMGVVTICYDHLQRFPFAIKTFREDVFLNDVSTLAAFTREARIWTGLGSHPHIVRAFGTRLIEDVPYLFLECVPGPTLKQVLQKGCLEAPDAIEVGLQICRALRYARSRARGFVHGDLKPSNLLVCKGVVKVTDFGLARDLLRKQQRSGAAGPPAYMAPEQWSGVGLSEKTDVYALGAVLYELLSGRKPFEYKSIRQYKEQRKRDLPPPPLHLGTSWDALNDVVAQCLAKPQEARPDLKRLETMLGALAVPAQVRRIRRPAPIRSPWAWWQRKLAGWREGRRIRSVLAFGSAYAGGIEEAIRRQLANLQGRNLKIWELQRLIALSKLRDSHPDAFKGWTAGSIDFSGLELAGRDLRGLYLPGADLGGLNLSGADLRGANLRGALLIRCDLRRTKLRWADLSCVRLNEAQLEKTDLRKTDLSDAELGFTDFRGCPMAGVKLGGVSYLETRLDPSALPSVRALLHQPKRASRMQGLGLLERVEPHPKVLAALQQPLQDPEEAVWTRAAELLKGYDVQAAVAAPLLVKQARSASLAGRLKIVEVLECIGDFRGLGTMSFNDWQKSLDVPVRVGVHSQTGQGREDKQVVRLLVSLSQASETSLQCAAVHALGCIEPRLESSREALHRALRGPPEVALEALSALRNFDPGGELAGAKLASVLRRALRGSPAAALEAVREWRRSGRPQEVGGDALLAGLRRALASEELARLHEVLDELEALGLAARTAGPELAAALQHDDEPLRLRLIGLLRRLAFRRALPALRALENDSRPSVRGASRRAVGELSSSSAVADAPFEGSAPSEASEPRSKPSRSASDSLR